MVEAIMLGDTKINPYIKELESISTDKATYPEIDLSFLSMSNRLNVCAGFFNQRKYQIWVPKFSVYKMDKESPEFSLSFYYFGIKSNRNEALKVGMSNNGEDIPKILADPLFDSLGFSKTSKKIGGIYFLNFSMLKNQEELKRDLYFLNAYMDIAYHQRILRTQFIGITPDKTLERIRESKKIFDIKRIYAIAETRPEDWSVVVPPRDPLVIGLKDDKAYLIDKYDPTSLEDVIAREWTIGH